MSAEMEIQRGRGKERRERSRRGGGGGVRLHFLVFAKKIAWKSWHIGGDSSCTKWGEKIGWGSPTRHGLIFRSFPLYTKCALGSCLVTSEETVRNLLIWGFLTTPRMGTPHKNCIAEDFTSISMCINVYNWEKLVSVCQLAKMRISKSYRRCGLDPKILKMRTSTGPNPWGFIIVECRFSPTIWKSSEESSKIWLPNMTL